MRMTMWSALGISLALASLPAEAGRPREDAAALAQHAHLALASGRPARARSLMERAAASGDVEALNSLATFVERGVGGEPNPKAALKLFERAAERGSVGAKLNLGLRLTASERVEDQQRAVEWLTDVRNNPPDPAVSEETRSFASAGLGVAFLLGRGVLADVARGVDYLEEADARGGADERTLFLLGRAYQRGWDVREPDPQRAVGYFSRAAALGHAEAAWQMGLAHLRGQGAERSDALAYDWFVRAGEAGDVRGDVSAAVLLSQGRGVVEDDALARRRLERAAERGSPHALRGLGEMLLSGEGGARDEARGLAFVMLAESAGVKGASDADRLALDAQLRERATRLAAQWLRDHPLARASR
jgi:hypothetical protein